MTKIGNIFALSGRSTLTIFLVNHFLELLHRQRADRLKSRLGLENAQLFREGIDALARSLRWLLLQLHVEGASELELTALLQLRGCKSDHGLGDLLDLAGLQASLLSNQGVG